MAPTPKPVDNGQLSKAMVQLEEMKKHSEELIRKIQQLEHDKTADWNIKPAEANSSARATASTPANPTPMSTLGVDDIFEKADPSLLPDHCPTDDEKGKLQLAVCGHFHQLLQLWIQGGYLPATFAELWAHSTAGGTCWGYSCGTDGSRW